MSSSSGASGRALIRRLQSQSNSFELVQVLRILGQLERSSGRRQTIKLRVRRIPRYARTEVLSVQSVSSGWLVECAVESLTGPRGVLPYYLLDASLALEMEAGDRAFGDFFALFEECWLDRLGRSYKKYDLACLAEDDHHSQPVAGHSPYPRFSLTTGSSAASTAKGNSSRLKQLLLSLLPGGGRWVNTPERFIRFIGLLGPGHRHLEGLQNLLTDYFGLRSVVRTAPVRRHQICDDAKVVLGTRGQNHQLGGLCPLGSGGYLDNWRIDILLFPQGHDALLKSLTRTELRQSVHQLARLYLADCTPVALFVMARRRFLKAPVLSSRKPESVLGQTLCLAPERNSGGSVRIRLNLQGAFSTHSLQP